MVAIGEVRRFAIGVHNTNVLLTEQMDLQGVLAVEDTNRSFRAVVKNEGQAPLHIFMLESANGGAVIANWSTALEPDNLTPCVGAVAPGAQRSFEFVVGVGMRYINYGGNANLSRITLPPPPGTGYAEPGGTVIPKCHGSIRLISLDRREPVGVTP